MSYLNSRESKFAVSETETSDFCLEVEGLSAVSVWITLFGSSVHTTPREIYTATAK